MSEQIRAAAWCALSSLEQNRGDDKTSMRDQLERCRKAISDKGWQLATTYQSIGSRTKAVEISVIRAENPVFDAMINDAEKGLYDVLVMVDYDRLRDMLAPVSRVLESFGAQLYSLNQPHDIQPPAQFDPYFNETGEMNRMLSSSIQRMKTNQLRRDYFTKMPRRVTERGLAPSKLPYGYRKPPGHERDHSAVAEQDPDLVPYLYAMRDALFAGKSLAAIAERLDNIGAPTPGKSKKWWPQVVKDTLTNPFYYGVVTWGKTKKRRNPLTGKVKYKEVDGADYFSGEGKHAPIWDEDTHKRILEEIEKRGINYQGKRANQFTSLMECGICEQRMWMYGNGAVHDPTFGITDPTRRIWRCRNNEHPPLPHMAAVDIVGYVLREAVLHPALIAPPTAPREIPDYANLPTLQAQRARLQEGFMAGIFTAVEFHERVKDIDDKIKAIEEGRAQVEKAQDRRKNFLDALGGLSSMAARIPEWLATEDPPVVNTTLRTVLAGIVWHAERGTVTLRWDDK